MALQDGKLVIFNAHIYYTKIKNPALKYGTKPVPGKPMVNREYVVDVLVTNEDFKKLKAKYKTVKSIKEAKEFTAAEFEETFKAAPPFTNEDDVYMVIKFKKSADYKDGNPAPKPKVVGKKGSGISIDTEIGNGTQAHIQWKEREWTYEGKKGLSLDLVGVAVVELVKYEAASNLDFGDEFEEGAFEEDDAPFGDGFEEEEASDKEDEPEDDGWA